MQSATGASVGLPVHATNNRQGRLIPAYRQPPHEGHPIPDFAKTSLVDLILFQTRKTHPDLVPTLVGTLDSIRQAHVPTHMIRDILNLVLREAGPEALLAVGQGVLSVGYDPVWHAAVRSASPALLFDKWKRFEAFSHSHNRARIELTHENRATVHRHTVDGGVPTLPENLLICGLTIALLEKIGCQGLTCQMPLADGTTYCIRQNGRFALPEEFDTLVTTEWVLEWQGVTARAENEILDTPLLHVPYPPSCGADVRDMIDGIVRILMLDVARQWKISDLAREAGFSTRSLQRKLGDAGISFSRLVRLVRIHEACRLLKDSDAPVTSIGFCAGFSDSAHFSRDFRASMGMSPTDYRAVFSPFT